MTNLRPVDALVLLGVVATIAFLVGFAAASEPVPPPMPPISVEAATQFFFDRPMVIEGWLSGGRLCQTPGCATGAALEMKGAALRDADHRVLVLGTVTGHALVLTPLHLRSKVAHL